MRLSYRVELQPTPTQRRSLLQHAGNARWAYNWGLRKRIDAYEAWVEAGKPKKWDWPNYVSLHRELVRLKKLPVEKGGVPWMYKASKYAPLEALRDLEKAFKNFFAGRTKFPRFKSRRNQAGEFRIGSIRVDRQTVKLPTVGRIRIKPGDHGYIPFGDYGLSPVKEQGGRWFISVVGPEIPDNKSNGKPAVGVDLGVARLATLSDGTFIENPKALASEQRKIKRLQKEVSRKQKGSKNRGKARRRLAKAYARVRNIRRDALHKATTMLTKSHGRIVIEDLKVQNMTRKGRGKRGLNRVVLDAAFGEFRRQLEYKGKLYGCEIVAINPAYTSQRCSACGHVDAGNRVSQSEFRCLSCGFEINADLNAAINILEAGSCPDSLNACGEGVRPDLRIKQISVKQESVVA